VFEEADLQKSKMERLNSYLPEKTILLIFIKSKKKNMRILIKEPLKSLYQMEKLWMERHG